MAKDIPASTWFMIITWSGLAIYAGFYWAFIPSFIMSFGISSFYTFIGVVCIWAIINLAYSIRIFKGRMQIPQTSHRETGRHDTRAVVPTIVFAEPRSTREMEAGMHIQKSQIVCIVHKGPVEGKSYICPACQTVYCEKCMLAVKKNGDNCWTCGNHFI
nr:hypothetical protein [Candidatus Sigynarchaeota archaeon]